MIKRNVKHYLCLALGLVLMAFSVALAKLSGLGTSPISSVPNVLSLLTPLTIGQTTMIFMTLVVVLEAVILGRDFNWRNIVQLVPTFLFGELIDVAMRILAPFAPHAYWARFLAVCMATVILALGVFFEVNSRTIMMAGEGIAAAFAFRLKRPFAVMKVRCDIGMIVLAVLIAVIFTHHLVGVREGTILAALLTGRCVGFIERLSPRFTAWVQD